jgi:hypothetical protein
MLLGSAVAGAARARVVAAAAVIRESVVIFIVVLSGVGALRLGLASPLRQVEAVQVATDPNNDAVKGREHVDCQVLRRFTAILMLSTD